MSVKDAIFEGDEVSNNNELSNDLGGMQTSTMTFRVGYWKILCGCSNGNGQRRKTKWPVGL